MTTEFSTSGLSDALVILGAAGIVIPTFARFRIARSSASFSSQLVGRPVRPMSPDMPWLRYITISIRRPSLHLPNWGSSSPLLDRSRTVLSRLWDAASRLRVARPTARGRPIIALGIHLVAKTDRSTCARLAAAFHRRRWSCRCRHVEPGGPIAFACCCSRISPSCRSFRGLRHRPHAQAEGFSGLLTPGLGALTMPPCCSWAARASASLCQHPNQEPRLFLSAACSLSSSPAWPRRPPPSPIVGALVAGILIAETEYRAKSNR